MRHFEFSKDSSHKFWEGSVSGKSLTVRFGALGSSGQTRTKAFASASVAQTELEKLIREKTSKGYVEGRTVAKRVPTGGDAELVRAALAALDDFLEALPPPLTTELVKPIAPVTKQQLATFEKRAKRPLSAGARALFLQGLTTARIIGDDAEGFAQIDFVPLATISKRLSWWGDWESEEENAAVGWQLRRAQKPGRAALGGREHHRRRWRHGRGESLLR